MSAFGPVPSRRLGRSVGINNIPAKTCSYSCVYCQVGQTLRRRIERQGFYAPEHIVKEVTAHVARARSMGEPVDYLTFVPDGEPTLDQALGEEIARLKPLGIRIAVITNASLIQRADVRRDLAKADLVSLKVDSVSEAAWRRVNRPHGHLKLTDIIDGMLTFARAFTGEILTETMLVDTVNDHDEDLEGLAEFLAELGPSRAYVAVPTRPPAEPWVQPAGEAVVNRAYHLFSDALGTGRVEYLLGYEGNAFASTGNVEEDLLSITAVHPMREDAVDSFLRKANADWRVVETLTREGTLLALTYRGHTFYMRKLPSRH